MRRSLLLPILGATTLVALADTAPLRAQPTADPVPEVASRPYLGHLRPHERALARPLDASLFASERTAPSGWTETRTDDAQVITESLVRFPSPKGGEVTARLYVPTMFTGRLAGLVMGHGAWGSSATLAPRARYLARHGAVVLVVDAPFVRRDPQVPLRFTAEDSAELVQQVVDYRRALDYLAARSDVDAARLGFVGDGHSAFAGALLAGIEPRLRAVALAMGDASQVEHFRDERGRWNRFFDRGIPKPQRKAWRAALEPLDARAWMARASAPGLLLQNGLDDEVVPPHAAQALHDAAPPHAERRWYPSGHRVSPDAFVDQLVFFSRHLGLTPPTVADEAGPYPYHVLYATRER